MRRMITGLQNCVVNCFAVLVRSLRPGTRISCYFSPALLVLFFWEEVAQLRALQSGIRGHQTSVVRRRRNENRNRELRYDRRNKRLPEQMSLTENPRLFRLAKKC